LAGFEVARGNRLLSLSALSHALARVCVLEHWRRNVHAAAYEFPENRRRGLGIRVNSLYDFEQSVNKTAT
jgi:hypothetical protein